MKTKYKNRIILVSDMHYTTQELPAELKLIYPEAKASVAAGNTLGHSQEEKIACIVNDIKAFTEKENINGILVLGDLSIDDYSFRNLPENYCKKFKELCMDVLPCPSYAIPGNHDSYPNDMWNAIFGYDRQFSLEIKGAAFILLDTFDNKPATSASGSPYVGVDMEFLKQEIEKYPEGPIFICSHYFKPGTYTDEFIELLNSNKRIVCLFDGHTHKNKILPIDERVLQRKVNIGGYGYQGEKREDGKWYFDRYDDTWAWGYEVLEWNNTEAHVYHVKPARRYVGCNGMFEHPYTIENELLIQFYKNTE